MTDVRCPQFPSRMFCRVVDGMIEVACKDCRNHEPDPTVVMVLHYYRFDGTWSHDHTLRAIPRKPLTL